jgi:osmoprotectant transport system substrate-binding protein
MKKRILVAVLCMCLVAVVAVACTATTTTTPTSGTTAATSTAGSTKGPIRIGSKIDTEGQVLGQIILQMLQSKGFTVEDKTRTGTTEVVRKALTVGEIDGYPEYTATALTQFFPGEKVDPAILKNAALSYAKVKSLDASNSVDWLTPAPADNTWAVAIPKKLAQSKNIKTLADWAAYIKAGNPVKVAGSQEFFSRSDAFPAFAKAYGIVLTPQQKVILATGDTSVTEKAASSGTNGVNAAMAYGTDGSISALGLVTLEDPKVVQPIYAPAPTFRSEIMKKYPEIPAILDPVFAKLDTVTLQKLNGDVAVAGKDAKSVAQTWLQENGFLPK